MLFTDALTIYLCEASPLRYVVSAAVVAIPLAFSAIGFLHILGLWP